MHTDSVSNTSEQADQWCRCAGEFSRLASTSAGLSSLKALAVTAVSASLMISVLSLLERVHNCLNTTWVRPLVPFLLLSYYFLPLVNFHVLYRNVVSALTIYKTISYLSIGTLLTIEIKYGTLKPLEIIERTPSSKLEAVRGYER